MAAKKDFSSCFEVLRRQAEEILEGRQQKEKDPSSTRSRDMVHLIHELEVHEEELKIQNEELRAARSEAEASRDAYANLYDSAPVGYVTLNRKGIISQANLLASRLLGLPKHQLTDLAFSRFVHPENHPAYFGIIQQISANGATTKRTCELKLLPRRGDLLYAHLEIASSQDEDGGFSGWLITFFDISTRIRAERDIQALKGSLEEQVAERTAALRESAERFRVLVESTAQAVWEMDADGMVVKDSPTWRAFTGQTIEEWTGYGWVNAVHPDDREDAERQWREAVTLQRNVDAEFRLRSPDGEYRWTNFHAAPIVAPDGRIVKWVGMNIDITERKRLEQRLRTAHGEAKQRAAELNAALESLAEGVIFYDLRHCITHINPSAKAMLGFSLEDVSLPAEQRIELFKLLTKDGRAPQREELPGWRALQGEIVRGDELIIFPKGADQPLHLLTSASPVRMADGKVVGAIQTLVDISAIKHLQESLRKSRDQLESRVKERTIELEQTNQVLREEINDREKAEMALRESEQRFREVLENSLDVSYRRNLKTDVYDYMSPRIAELSGYRPEDMLTMTTEQIVSLIHPEDREQVVSALKEAMEQGREQEKLEYRFKHTDGSYRWFSHLIAIVKDAEGRPVYRVGSLRDITNRKNAENELKDSETRLRYLSSKLLSAHEEERKRIARELHDSISSSLTAIKMDLGNLDEMVGEDAEAAESIKRLTDVTLQTMNETRAIMNALRPAMLDDLGLVTTIGAFCKSFRSIHKDIFIVQSLAVEEKDIPEDLKTVIYRMMQEAFNNIAKYSQAELVELSLSRKDETIELAIADNGVGFEVSEALSKANDEKGVGLTSMRERAELSGGSFRIESIPGEGTTISASWPLRQ